MKALFDNANKVKKLVKDHYVGSGGGVAASGGGARGHPLQISNLPVPDGSGTNFYYTGNASGYPLIINNKLGVSIFGKEVVDMDGFNDGRKIILTQRETTKADSAGDSSASSQKGFMDMNLNHRAVSDISEDPSSDHEDDFQDSTEDFIGSYFFKVVCKILLLFLNIDLVSGNSMMGDGASAEHRAATRAYQMSFIKILQRLYDSDEEKGEDSDGDTESWFYGNFAVSVSDDDDQKIMTNLSRLRLLCGTLKLSEDDEDMSMCNDYFDYIAARVHLNDKILMDSTALLVAIDDFDGEVESGVYEPKSYKTTRTVCVTTHDNKHVRGDVLLESPLVLRLADGKFTEFQNPPIDIQNV